MRILLLGASGRTGQLTLEYALAQGHSVVALVRDSSKVAVKSDKLTLIKGTPENPSDVARAISGVDAVVSTLNNVRTSDMPWAKPLSPPHLMDHSIRNAVAAMRASGIKRLVTLSATGVGDSLPYTPGLLRWLINHTNLGTTTYADHNYVDAFLREQADIDWTQVRAARLSNAEAIKPNIVVSYANRPKPAATISRRHVAKFLIDSLGDASLTRKSPVVSER